MTPDIEWWTGMAVKIRAAGRGDIAIDAPVREMRDVLGFDCAALIAGSDSADRKRPLAALVNLGYSADTLAYITSTYGTTCPVHREIVRRRAATRFVDVPFDFRRTRTYAEAIRPNRFREGLTLPLLSDRRDQMPGFLAMSSSHAQPLDDQSRLGLSLLAHDLSELIAPAPAGADAPVSVEVRLTGGRTEYRRGTAAESPLTPAELRFVAAAAGHGPVSVLHHGDDDAWWRVRATASGRGVLVRIGPVTPVRGLTARELDVVGLVARGWTNEATAGALGIASRTVRSHIESALLKLDCANRTMLARFSYENEIDTITALRASQTG
jgi:DNA-binding CsgD family transcriptional regulator